MRKLKNLAIATLMTLILTLLLAACGGSSQPDPQEPDVGNPTRTTTTESRSASTPENLPTKPVPLTNLGAATPTTLPDPTRARPTRAPEDTTTSETTTQPPKPTAGIPSTQRPEDLIPQDPATNDTILLQDIYELMDLDQFALDPTEPIETFEYGKVYGNIGTHGGIANLSTFNVAETLDHPYIYLFPKLKHYLEREGEQKRPRTDIPYSPYMDHTYNSRNHLEDHSKLVKEFSDRNPLVYFIYHPWFETLLYSNRDHTFTLRRAKYGPFWFGNNSTRGVLSDAVAKAMTQAKYPATEPLELIWHRGDPIRNQPTPNDRWESTNWRLEDYLRTTVGRFNDARSDQKLFPKPFEAKGGGIGRYMAKTYLEPIIQWEFVHPELPILKITAQNATMLPLTVGDLEEPEPTEYSVSFVISLQNRWASLDDPNRRLARFPQKTSILIKNPFRGANDYKDDLILTPDLGRWNFTDYMQHRIIGPVVVQINKSEVLEPGLYSVTPKVTSWDAPGHIPLDEQLMHFTPDTDGFNNPKPEQWSFHNPHESVGGYRLEKYHVDWPLAGHILTTPDRAPGSFLWSFQKMDQNDW